MRTYNDNEQTKLLVLRYEEMLREENIQFLDLSSFEQIIDFYKAKQNLSSAHLVADHAMEQYAYSSTFYLKKAQLFFEEKRWNGALAFLEKAEVYDASEIEIHLLKAEVFSNQSKYDAANEIIDYLLSIVPDNEVDAVHLTRAAIFEDMDRYDLAFDALCDCLTVNPRNLAALERIYLAIEIAEKYKESVKIHLEVIDEDPYSCLAWYNLGHAYLNLDQHEEAIDAFGYVMVIDDKFEFAYSDCADAYFSCGMYEKALEIHEEYIELFDADVEVYTKSGMCYEQLGQIEKAKLFYLSAIEIDPENDLPHYRLGECLAKEDKWVAALNCYLKAIELNDTSSDYFTALGIAYFHQEDIEQANEMFSKACDLAPDECDKWIQYAIFLQEIDLANSALDIIEEAFVYSCNSKCLYYCKAACLFGLGRRKEGFQVLNEALTLDTEKSDMLYEFLPTLKEDTEVAMAVASHRA